MDRCGRRDLGMQRCEAMGLINCGLGDHDVHFYIVRLWFDCLQSCRFECNADDERKRDHRGQCPVVVTTAVPKAETLFVEPKARNQQTLGLHNAALCRHRDSELARTHRRVRRPGAKCEHLAIDNREGRNAPRIRRQPGSNDRAQIGLTLNRKVKPQRMYIGVLQPIRNAALHRCFKSVAVDERGARLGQSRALQLLVGSTIQTAPYATNKCCTSVAIVGFTRAVHDLIRLR